jgi:hypothetical protein
VQIRNWIKRYRDRIEQRRSKARELAHIQAREAEKLRQAAEAAEHARQAAEVKDAKRLAAAEQAARLAAEADEAARLAAETEASLQSGPPPNESEQALADHLPRYDELIAPSEVTPEPLAPLTGAPSKRRSRQRRRRERTQS